MRNTYFFRKRFVWDRSRAKSLWLFNLFLVRDELFLAIFLKSFKINIYIYIFVFWYFPTPQLWEKDTRNLSRANLSIKNKMCRSNVTQNLRIWCRVSKNSVFDHLITNKITLYQSYLSHQGGSTKQWSEFFWDKRFWVWIQATQQRWSTAGFVVVKNKIKSQSYIHHI